MKGTGGVRMNHSHKREAENCEKVTRAENLYSEHVGSVPGSATLVG